VVAAKVSQSICRKRGGRLGAGEEDVLAAGAVVEGGVGVPDPMPLSLLDVPLLMGSVRFGWFAGPQERGY
jgi:hypothetical protein